MDFGEWRKLEYAFEVPPSDTPFSVCDYEDDELDKIVMYMLNPEFGRAYLLGVYLDDPFSDEQLPALGAYYADDKYYWLDIDACLVGLYHIEIPYYFSKHINDFYEAGGKVGFGKTYHELKECIKNKKETGRIWKEFKLISAKENDETGIRKADYRKEREYVNVLKYLTNDNFRKSEIIALLGNKRKPVYVYHYEDGTYRWNDDEAWNVGLKDMPLSSDFVEHVGNFYKYGNKVKISKEFTDLYVDMMRHEKWQKIPEDNEV